MIKRNTIKPKNKQSSNNNKLNQKHPKPVQVSICMKNTGPSRAEVVKGTYTLPDAIVPPSGTKTST